MLENETNPTDIKMQLKTTEDFYLKKIKQLQLEYNKNTQQREREMEELFAQLEEENTKIKRKLMDTQFILEKEKETSLTMKETYFNLNSFDESNNEIDRIVYENIKQIKSEADINFSQIEEDYNIQINSLKREFKHLRSHLSKILDESQLNNHSSSQIRQMNSEGLYQQITEDIIELYEKKLMYLLEDNLNKGKYSNSLTQKYELATEENNFLRNRIMEEKTTLVEKIEEIETKNYYSHFEMTKTFLNELNEKKKNYFNEKFKEPVKQIKSYLELIVNENEQLRNDKERIRNSADELRSRVERLLKENNSLMQSNHEYIQSKQRQSNNDLNLNMRIHQLEEENYSLKEKYNTILNDISVIKLKNGHFNNELELKVNQVKRENIALTTLKDSTITQIKKEIAMKEKESNELKSRKEAIEKMIEEQSSQIVELEDKSQKAIEENSKLKTAIQKAQLSLKMCDENMTTFEYLNQTLEKKNALVQKEKEEAERKYAIINTKFITLNYEYSNLKSNMSNLNQSQNDISNRYNEAIFKLQQNEKSIENSKDQLDLLHNIQEVLRQIYQCNFPLESQSNKNEITMLKELNEKISNRMSAKSNIPLNEPFKQLEQSKNSQLYESLILFIINLKSHNSLDIFQALNENQPITNTTSNGCNINTQISINARSLEELRFQIEEKYTKYEKRICNSIIIQDFETIIIDAKTLYEQIIDKIIQSFYKHQRETTDNAIVTFQMPLDKYNQIISNLHTNLEKMSKKLNSILDEYKRQGSKIESAINLLMKHISI